MNNSYFLTTTRMGKDGKVFEEKYFFARKSEGILARHSGNKNVLRIFFLLGNKLIQPAIVGA